MHRLQSGESRPKKTWSEVMEKDCWT